MLVKMFNIHQTFMLTWSSKTLSPDIFLIPVCQAVWSQRKAVVLWPQLWAPTPPIWESWTWATIIQETQEWSFCQLDWRIHTGDWRLSGMDRWQELTHCRCLWFLYFHVFPLWSVIMKEVLFHLIMFIVLMRKWGNSKRSPPPENSSLVRYQITVEQDQWI